MNDDYEFCAKELKKNLGILLDLVGGALNNCEHRLEALLDKGELK